MHEKNNDRRADTQGKTGVRKTNSVFTLNVAICVCKIGKNLLKFAMKDQSVDIANANRDVWRERTLN